MEKLTMAQKENILSIIDRMQRNENARCERHCKANVGNNEEIRNRRLYRSIYNAALSQLESIIRETM